MDILKDKPVYGKINRKKQVASCNLSGISECGEDDVLKCNDLGHVRQNRFICLPESPGRISICNNKLASVSFYIYNKYQYPADPAPDIYGYDLNQREI